MDNENEKPGNSGRSWYQYLDPVQYGRIQEVPSERQTCPEYQAGWFSRLTFDWMTPMIVTSHRRTLEKNDIWLVNPKRSVRSLEQQFNDAFSKHVQEHHKHALLAALHDTFKREFWVGAAWLFAASVSQVMIPFTLKYLLDYVTAAYKAKKAVGAMPSQGPPVGVGMGYVFGILGMQLVQSVGTNQFIYHGFMVGAQARTVLIAVLFKKSLMLSTRARAGNTNEEKEDAAKNDSDKGYTNGRITTLMSSDVGRIDTAAGMFHLIWSAPLQIFLAFALLLLNLTYSAIVGFGTLLVGITVLTFALKSLIKRRKIINEVTDTRVSLTQEVLASVRFIKYNAWEGSFLQRLAALRTKEVNMVIKLNTTRNALNALSIALPIFAAMFSIIVYATTGHALLTSVIFSSMALFTALRVPFNLLPLVIGQLADALSAVGRLSDFLTAEEQEEHITWDKTAEAAINVENATFVWEKKASEKDSYSGSERLFSLDNINFEVQRGELLAVVGSVGAGKTSLLCALADEMRKTEGHVTLGASSRAYCPQQAWIQNATLKQNIIFDQPLDHERYNEVVKACSLGPDLETLPAGEETEIGERGVNLSGGQQQRVNLARAMYADRDIILMDDPLSAVDAHVGRHIFEHAICGMLKGKTRILSTHQLHVLSRCDKILWLQDGHIKAHGTWTDLFDADPEFRAFVKVQQQDDSTEEDKVPRDAQVVKSEAPLPAGDGLLVREEERAVGSLSWKIVSNYIQSSGSPVYGLMAITLLILAQGTNALTSIWLSWWISNRFDLKRDTYIALYVCIALLQTVMLFSFGAGISILAGRSSRKMVDSAMKHVTQAPMSFHDTQPLGRMMNRLSRDVEVMDNQLPDAVRMFMYTVTIVTSIIVLLCVYFHWFLVALPFLAAAFVYATAYYRSSATQLKRYDATLRGIMFARFGESITGIPTIRAYGVQDQMVHRIHEAIDDMDSAYFLTLSNQRWVTCRLDIVAILTVTILGLLVVILRDYVEPSVSGLVLSYSISITQMMQLAVRQLSEVENAMISTERLYEYGTALPQETSLQQLPGQKHVTVPSSWPQRGEIIMANVQLRYRPGLPLVLHGLNLNIRGGEKVGIVGRTGAGKSSISTSLFRLVELCGGTITIDDIDIAQIPLNQLRSRISIVPQDPHLFQGTVRSNLDPLGQHEDLALWDVLRRVGLYSSQTDTHFHLDASVDERGANFSQGQRQLITVARALIRNSRIIIFDEATSSVDLETDGRIQQVIVDAFAGQTVLTIAHRLNTIVDYDKVCVLEQGRIVEFGEPFQLWETQNSVFRSLCDKGRIDREDFKIIRQ
ncbi:Multidrug resistance fer6 [Hyphodiscus hymeniophilus]|uniref:Multidrug resistance fer6 n=1 Tax=Hyphodiscus hymeniophilus TaxID=353542 RepID=A0A9P7AUD3_9HELO|nr:Multidrug resistance fer6 [Hyphodiscus hymeniophilus]